MNNQMKKITITLMMLCAVLNGCHNHPDGRGHEEELEERGHEDHGHEKDKHGHESHDHKEGERKEHDGHDYKEDKDGHRGHRHNEGEIVLSEARQKTLGITVGTVALQEFSEVIRTSGQIVPATGDEMTVVAKTEGIVNLGNLAEGSAVGRGARIASISSKELGTGDRLAKARIAYETAKKEYDRDLQLREDNIVSESHLDQSRLAYEMAKTEYGALSSGGASAGGVVVTSPLAGFVKNLLVKSGDYVETGTPIATVSQNRRLQLKADVSEKHYGDIIRIADASFKTSCSDKIHGIKDLGGKLVSYGKASEGDFYIPVTFEFDNRGDILSGSYAEVFLKTAATRQTIAIPLSAVVEDQGVYYVFVRQEPDSFIRKEVALGQSDGDRVLVKSGLAEGDIIVITGAVRVRLASVTAVPAGHNHNH